jgi:hypothetical protein
MVSVMREDGVRRGAGRAGDESSDAAHLFEFWHRMEGKAQRHAFLEPESEGIAAGARPTPVITNTKPGEACSWLSETVGIYTNCPRLAFCMQATGNSSTYASSYRSVPYRRYIYLRYRNLRQVPCIGVRPSGIYTTRTKGAVPKRATSFKGRPSTHRSVFQRFSQAGILCR